MSFASTVVKWLRRAFETARWVAEGERLPPAPETLASKRRPWVLDAIVSDSWPAEQPREATSSGIGWLIWLTATEELPTTAAPSGAADRPRHSPPGRGFLRWVIAPEPLPAAPGAGDRDTDAAGLLRWLMQTERLPGSGEVSREEEGKRGD